MNRFLSLLILSICALPVMAQNLKTINKPAYSVKYPDTWTVEPSTGAKQFTVKTPSDGEEDVFGDNVNMVSYAVAGYNSKTYAAYSKTYLPQKVKNFKVLEEKAITQNGKEGYYIVFTGKQEGQLLKWKQVYFIINGTGYVLTFTAQQTVYNKYIKEATQVLNSFVIK
jgi:eukaryotic-like serine/threonine-protein kinase